MEKTIKPCPIYNCGKTHTLAAHINWKDALARRKVERKRNLLQAPHELNLLMMHQQNTPQEVMVEVAEEEEEEVKVDPRKK